MEDTPPLDVRVTTIADVRGAHTRARGFVDGAGEGFLDRTDGRADVALCLFSVSGDSGE